MKPTDLSVLELLLRMLLDSRRRIGLYSWYSRSSSLGWRLSSSWRRARRRCLKTKKRRSVSETQVSRGSRARRVGSCRCAINMEKTGRRVYKQQSRFVSWPGIKLSRHDTKVLVSNTKHTLYVTCTYRYGAVGQIHDLYELWNYGTGKNMGNTSEITTTTITNQGRSKEQQCRM